MNGSVQESEVQSRTLAMTGLVALSRVSGLVRLGVSFVVLGTETALGNVYSTANMVPTIVFEFLVAGALGATLIPRIQRAMAENDDRAVRELLSTVLFWGLVGLGLVMTVLAIFRHDLAGLILHEMKAADDPAAARRVLAALLVIFLPQLPAYLANAVAVGYLHANRRFAASVACPLINNAILIATYVVFSRMVGPGPSVDMSTGHILLLGLGTTAGVVAMCAYPFADAWIHGMRFSRPRGLGDGYVRTLLSEGGWAALFLAGGQLVAIAALPLTNARPGQALVWAVVSQVFLLPYALMAVPVLTARFPELASAASLHDRGRFVDVLTIGLRSIVTTGVLAGAVIWAVARPVAHTLAVGSAENSAPMLMSGMTWVGFGIAAYGAFNLLSRACYALDDQRSPGLASIASAIVGIAVMYALAYAWGPDDRLAAVAIGVVIAAVLCVCGLWAAIKFHEHQPTAEPTLLVRRSAIAFAPAIAVRIMVGRAPEAWPPLVFGVVAAAGAAVIAVVFVAADSRLSKVTPMAMLRSLGAEVGPIAPRSIGAKP